MMRETDPITLTPKTLNKPSLGGIKIEKANESATERDDNTLRRWATRPEAILYSKGGVRKFDSLLRNGRIRAKKLDGTKIVVDLNSNDSLCLALPEAWARQ
jgi:hypothetical protein